MNPTPELEVLISAERLRERITELGREITRDYSEKSLVLLCVLKGSFIFTADLARAIDLPLRIEFLGVQSYGNALTSSGEVRVTHDLTNPVQGEDVLIVEDIVDSGITSAFLIEQLGARKPRSIKLCALMQKPGAAVVDVSVDYLGFTIGDGFIVGYGLDAAQKYRNLPDLCLLRGV